MDIHPKGGFPLSRNFFCAYARKIPEVQLLPLNAAFHTLPLFYLRTKELRDSGNPPLLAITDRSIESLS